MQSTRTDPSGAREWAVDDDVIHLREWATDRTYPLPTASTGEWTVGSSASCAIRIEDPPRFISRQHAQLSRDDQGWMLRDLASKNGLWADDMRLAAFGLAAGTEIRMGSVRLIAESHQLIELRTYLARLIGWSEARRATVDEAIRSLRLAAMLRAPLAISGDGDLVATTREIHDRAFGRNLPFIVCDPRRKHLSATPRSEASRATAIEAASAAQGGTLCFWANRLPDDYALMRTRLAQGEFRLRLVVCHREPVGNPETAASIALPPLSDRVAELDRIIDDYAHDAIVQLDARPSSFSDLEREWLRHRQPGSLSEIARATERLVAIRDQGSIARAASRLGISRVALARWLNRRN